MNPGKWESGPNDCEYLVFDEDSSRSKKQYYSPTIRATDLDSVINGNSPSGGAEPSPISEGARFKGGGASGG